MHKKLFIPGPVEVRQDVLEKMATPMIGHRGKAASELQRSISEKLKTVFYTKEEILLSTSSGTGLMEGAVRSCTIKGVAVFSSGAFGDRWYEIAKCNNIAADIFKVDWGTHITGKMVDEALATGKYDVVTVTHNETSTGLMNPIEEIAEVMKKYPEVVWCVDTVSSMAGTKIEVDKLGIDICITSTQKCLGLPSGLSICSFSKKAVERAKLVEIRGAYLDLLSLYDFIQKKDYQYPSTPSISHYYALDFQLDRILAEGLDNRFARHLEMAEYVRAWAREHFELFSEDKYLSNTVTTITNTTGIDVGALNKELGTRGFEISNGYGKMKGKTFRIAHMADCTLEDIKELIFNIDDILGFK